LAFLGEESPLIVAIGEVLWDVFPNQSQLGGAPANFAVHCAALGAQSFLVSAVGQDALGGRALAHLQDRCVNTHWVARNQTYPTGTVQVGLQNGQPTYEIVQQVAWDHIPFQDGLETLSNDAQAICFGTLSQRSEQSLRTIQRFVGNTSSDCVRILDVNFRQNFHNEDVVKKALELATVLKLSQEEISVLRFYVGGSAQDEVFIDELLKRYQLDWVVLTQGELGACAFGRDQIIRRSGTSANVVNAVGAGDAFTAAFVCHLLKGDSIKTCLDQANKIGAFVVGEMGAMPLLPHSFQVFK